ncbi:DHA2 family efflux MFS transporter permease subunit [Furfurilactobacillus entadae]|uniref:DHA2 family efflux MFS transporter permease subunit n=1 Tax=Furfurilactobacillus entadae TaxID=2922307 RepID=UPI0035E4FC35
MKNKQMLLILTMCIGTFLCMLDTTVMNIALPAIQSNMNVSLDRLSWALNIYTITFAVLTIPLARLADIFGRNKVYLIGLLTFAIGSFVSGNAGIPATLIIGRGIQSIGAAIIFPTSMTIAIASTTQAKRKTALLTIGLTQGLASTLGPTIGGVVTQFLGWRWVFYINLPLLLIAFVGVVLQLPIRNETKINAKIDFGGMILLMVTLFSLTLALTQGTDWGWTSSRIISLAVLTIVAFVGFILLESRVESPMVRLDLFADRQFSGAALTVILAGLLLVAVMVIMPTFFTQVQNKTELVAALLVTPASFMIFLTSPIAGNLIEHFGPRLIITSGFIAMAAGYAVLGYMNPAHYWQTLLGLMLLGIGYGVVIGPITVLAASDFEGEKLTASQSVMGVLRQIGNVLAVAIFVSLLTSNISTAKTTAWHQAQNQINQTTLPQNVKTKMLSATHQHFTGTGASTTHHQESGISKQQAALIIRQQTTAAIAKANVDQLPAAQQTIIRPKIKTAVTQKVTTTVANNNHIIKQTSNHISTHTHTLISQAFLSLYRSAFPITISFIFVGFIFYRRHDYQALIHHDVKAD